MPPDQPPAIAVIADAHFHDLEGDYGISGVEARGRRMALRPFADTIKSTRVFNESGAALRHTLDDVAARGVRHVVLLGDYSDDGQITTLEGLAALLADYRQRFGMRFFAVPGNHDIFGPHGRHRAKRFLNMHGGCDLVTSDPRRRPGSEDDNVIFHAGMRCAGYPEGLLADIGFFRTASDLHWETPFGISDDPSSRSYEAFSANERQRLSLMDGSYLVEPFDGVWLLMIDANVFVPLDLASDGDADLADSSNAGWNAMLTQKPLVLDWIRNVSDRAARLGKALLGFSHYPALDPLDGTKEDELAVLGDTSLMQRIPGAEVGTALIEAGLRVHFSGHLHINDTARMHSEKGFLFNISVPSLVAFPAAYKIATLHAGCLDVETVPIGNMPVDSAIMEQYRMEAQARGIAARSLLDAASHGNFLSAHIGNLVGRRHLKRDWPPELADAARRMSLADLTREQDPVLAAIPVMTFLGDWYRLRMASDAGLSDIPAERLQTYLSVAAKMAKQDIADGSIGASFRQLLDMFKRFGSGLPSRDFSIDLRSGAVTDAVALS